MKAVNHGTGQVDLRHLEDTGLVPMEMRPSELHLKEDGTKTNGPSFTLVLERGPMRVYGQVSLDMLNEALGELGYTIIQP